MTERESIVGSLAAPRPRQNMTVHYMVFGGLLVAVVGFVVWLTNRTLAIEQTKMAELFASSERAAQTSALWSNIGLGVIAVGVLLFVGGLVAVAVRRS